MKLPLFPRIALLALPVMVLFSSVILAQQDTGKNRQDSLLILSPETDTTALAKGAKNIKVDSSAMNRPKTASFYAAALPGLGQIYNRDFWKLPILYGGAAVMGHYIAWNNNMYHDYLRALFDKQTGVQNNPLSNLGTIDNLKQGVDYYRRNRDYLMILMVGLYLVQIVDAQVQAQLMTFDISPDLTLNLKPVLSETGYCRNIGFGIILTID